MDSFCARLAHQTLKLAQEFTLRRLLPEGQTRKRYRDDQDRSQREDGVKRQRGSHARGIVICPGQARLLEQPECGFGTHEFP